MTVTVVGVGADGWAGLGERARAAVSAAFVLLGGRRQLDLVPADIGARRVAWPSPLLPALPGLLDEHAGAGLCVLASGDPMWFGIGSHITGILGPERVDVVPAPSTLSLACARMGWPAQHVDVHSAVGRPLAAVLPALAPGRRVLVLSAGGTGPAALADLLTAQGFGDSRVTVLENLGASGEEVRTAAARDWCHAECAALNVVAVQCAGGRARSRLPGLPDGDYEHDGQLTKRHVRALTLSALAPLPGQLLWDIGSGAGSIAIEWLRAHPSCRAVAVERDGERAARIRRNAERFGVPGIEVRHGDAPETLAGLDEPDAVFVGGGLTARGMLGRCWTALRARGTLVANAVTVESERVLLDWQRERGGDLARIDIAQPAAVGGFTAWRAAFPVTQLVARKS